jgi:hypothetical protein
MSLISAALAALSQWNSGIKPPLAPRPYPCKFYSTESVGSLLHVPDTATNDGSVFRFQGGIITRIGPTGTTIYTIEPTEIDASATETLAFAIDSVNNRLYVLVQWGAANIRLAFTPLASKSLTMRAAQTVTLLGGVGSRLCMNRAPNGVDFVLFMHASSPPQATQVHTITESTGAITAASAFTLGGVAPRINTVGGQRHGYVTLDQTMMIQIVSSAIWMNRGGGWAIFPWAAAGLGYSNDTGSTQGFMTTGDGIISTYGDGGGGEWLFPKTYVRAEFDAWLQRAADFMGLPK